MLLRTREADVGLTTGINTREIARTSRMVSRLTGYAVQPNKAIVGRNAFQHESGIHQDGVLKERSTYEIMTADSVGVDDVQSIVLGKHSGRHALQSALEELGYSGPRPHAQSGVQALQGDRGQEEARDRAGPGGARHRRAPRRCGRLHARVVRRRGLDAAPAARDRLDRHARRRARARRLHRRRPDRRDLPRDQRGHPARGASERVPHRRRHRRAGRARRGERHPRALGLHRRRPGRLHRHHRGGRARLRARALQRRAEGAPGGRRGGRAAGSSSPGRRSRFRPCAYPAAATGSRWRGSSRGPIASIAASSG